MSADHGMTKCDARIPGHGRARVGYYYIRRSYDNKANQILTSKKVGDSWIYSVHITFIYGKQICFIKHICFS